MQDIYPGVAQRLNEEPVDISSRRDVIAIGASAGGIQVLLRLAESLPDNFDAAVLVTVHIGRRNSLLAQLMDRAGPLSADFGQQGETIRSGRIYIAPPDQHMLVSDGHIEIRGGPRENHFRPAIDPLFRSVAAAYGDRVIGIVLSGALSDGTVGLATVKANGGLTIVQDPAEALVTSMPTSALANGSIDLVLTSEQLVATLPSLIRQSSVPHALAGQQATPEAPSDDEVIQQFLHDQAADLRNDGLTLFTCPDCGGTLWQVDEEGVMRFQCHVGHGWSWDALLDQKSDQLEASLWASSRLFVERSILQQQIATRLQKSGADPMREQQLGMLSQSDERKSRELQQMLAEMSQVEAELQTSAASSIDDPEAHASHPALRNSYQGVG